jgi:general L-amino acid transport system substrate-binding protein
MARTSGKGAALVAAFAGIAFAGAAEAGPTLDAVKGRGMLHCGVSQGLPGFSNPGERGQWSGIDVDFCRAVAAAVLGDANKVKYSALSAKERFTALQSGEIDVLSRNTTWTITRDAGLGLSFVGVTYYDGQGFMVRKSANVKSAKELNGAQVCVNAGTTTELNLADYFRSNRMDYKPVVFEHSDQVVAAYDAGRCDAYTTDQSGLYAQRLKLKNKDEHVVLPDIISKEPLGPAVRQGDEQWFGIARWTLFAMINAEELGVTSANIAAMKGSTNPEVKRLIGTEAGIGKQLGISDDWAFQIVRQVGNYGEAFDRNLGPKTPLGIARGLNRLWNAGGIMYAPPIR